MLAVLLTSAPGIRLSDSPEARGVALVPTHSVLFVADQLQAEGREPSVDLPAREQLAQQPTRQAGTRRSLLGPILLICAGAPLAVAGTGLAAAGGIFTIGNDSRLVERFLGSGLAMLATGVVMTIIGDVWLGFVIRARQEHGEKAARLRGGGMEVLSLLVN